MTAPAPASVAGALLDAAPDAIIAVDEAGRITLVNAQAVRLFGYTREELLGQLVDVLVPDGVRIRHPVHRQGYFAEPQPRPMGAGMHLAARRKDGTEFPAEISLSAIDTGRCRLVSAAIRDVTEQRRMAETRNHLASIVQSSHDAIVSTTLDGVVTGWNPGAERLYGFTSAQMLGAPIETLYPARHAARETAVRASIAAGERVEQYQTERVHADGSTVTVSVTMSPITDTGGGIVGIASVSRDISEQQRFEARFRGLLEAAPDAIVGVGRDGRIALINAQAARLFGYTAQELTGRPIEVLVPEHARAVHPQHRTAYFEHPAPRPMGAHGMQLAARRKDGTEFPAEISLSALGEGDDQIVSAAIRDVSERLAWAAEREDLRAQAERERLEGQLHQSQRLESLGQLAGGVAHDFNNLLAVMLNYTAFAAEEIDDLAAHAPDGSAERWRVLQRDIAQVQRAGDRATQLTHQLLAFGRREVVRPTVLDLNAVVAEVEQLLCRTLGEHVQLHTELTHDLWRVLADAGQMEQVLVNLAVNARDAMPDGGTLRIDSANVVVRGEAPQAGPAGPGRYVQLCVADTGAGIPPDVLARVFEPFFTTKPKGEGTGLGLATVYGIITQAGGHVRIDSVPGTGTTVTAMFPATDAGPEPAGERRQSVTTQQGGETVLVVEDEDALREVTRRLLTRNGYTVHVAAGGPEALKLVDEVSQPIHLLLTDVIMPKMLGKELAAAVLAARPDVRVLYMSGYAQPVLAERGTLDPGVRLVEKPFTEPDLLAHVREVLDDPGAR
ncbi:PAS domain S-box protein [Dactylosporangium sp. NBC_01737]|uniref:PAS domain S-box protein n=1 Tax=Dactylosporangium sp. NBC_01737 TaxID=2975959 RepID=UPI002E15997D|nr:PAS domain S-box protein [Dactylosporangium sp. NBC_01737]